jgi:4-aminobutyrate aminotransferase-like enzyme
MRQRTRDAWRQLVGAEAPASLLPVLYGSGPAGREARAATPVWSRARGPWVWDTDGRRYLDFVTGFGVAAVGHAHPRVTAAVARQVRRLAHGYGDVHPHEPRARLAARLAALAPWPRAHVLWAQSGSEAVELAWKSAYLATGRPGVLAFENGYHGESVGALSLTGLPAFRAPFAGLLPRRTVWGPYADCARCPLGLAFPACRFACVGEAFARADRADRRGPGIGAVLVEPIQGRGGVIVPPPGFLRAVRLEARRRRWLLIADEIYTGLGRTGRLFACEHDGVVPDLLCLGKALAGGLPLAAVLGRAAVLAPWRRAASGAEPAHAATFLAHPVSCAAALAALDVIAAERLTARAGRLGRRLRRGLDRLARAHPRIAEVRGRGMLAALAFARAGGAPDPATARAVMAAAQAEGLLVLTSGSAGQAVSLTPPLTLTEAQLDDGLRRLDRALEAVGGRR